MKHFIPIQPLDELWTFFRNAGQKGCEGTALLIGKGDGQVVHINRALIPEQECLRSKDGVAVRITHRAHRTLVDNLQPGEQFYIRVHSHPEEAYHSDTDDENAVLTHLGAISIVVPFFGNCAVDLGNCAIYELAVKGWLPLKLTDVIQKLEVIR